MADTTEVPIWGDELKYFINIGIEETPDWEEITRLLSWEDEGDEQTYEPSYIDMRTSPTYVLGTKASISYEKDVFRNNALDNFFTTNEGASNLPVEILRVYSWLTEEEGSGCKAKKAPFLLSAKMLSKPNSGEPVKATGSLSMADNGAWEDGTWSGTAFTSGE